MNLLTKDKIIQIFYIADEFCKDYSLIIKENKVLPASEVKKHRDTKSMMSDSEILTILILYHFGSFKNFKHF